jgi:hypothetical protein
MEFDGGRRAQTGAVGEARPRRRAPRRLLGPGGAEPNPYKGASSTTVRTSFLLTNCWMPMSPSSRP